MIRMPPAGPETQLQDVVNIPRSCKVLVSKGGLLKLAAKHQDLGPTDGISAMSPRSLNHIMPALIKPAFHPSAKLASMMVNVIGPIMMVRPRPIRIP